MATKKIKKISATQKVSIGVGLTAAAVAAAGAYFLHGSKDSLKNKKTVKSWVLKAKAEALEALEDAKEMSKGDYEELIDTIGATYSTVKNASKSDIATFGKEMKDHWEHIEKSAKPIAHVSKKIKKTAKKTLEKTVKQIKKKVTTKPITKKKSVKKVVKKKASVKKPAKKIPIKTGQKTTKKK